MENNNPQPVPEALPEQVAPVVSPQAPIKTSKLKELFNKLKTRTSSFKVSKKVVVGVVVAVSVILILSLVLALMNRNGGSFIPTPTASPSPSPTPQVEVPSEYADDDDVKAIQERMLQLEKSLNEKSFRDETLRIPSLDWDVTFQ